MELRIRPKSDYLHVAGWEELYVLTKHWKSDLEFYQDELHFFSDLIDKYFVWLIEDKNIKKVQKLTNQLLNTKKKQENINKKISKHLIHIEELMKNLFAHDETQFRKEHIELEEQFSTFIKDCRKLKKETFAITKEVLKEEKVKQLLTS